MSNSKLDALAAYYGGGAAGAGPGKDDADDKDKKAKKDKKDKKLRKQYEDFGVKFKVGGDNR